jgi:hypothetical protein
VLKSSKLDLFNGVSVVTKLGKKISQKHETTFLYQNCMDVYLVYVKLGCTYVLLMLNIREVCTGGGGEGKGYV